RDAVRKLAVATAVGGFSWVEMNQARDFEHEVRPGRSAIEAIRSATSVAAELLGLTGRIGALEPGAFADIVAVSGDPLKDVAVLQKIDWVMKGGEVVRALPTGGP